MREESGHLQQLVALGLTRYEAKAYLALIQRESFAAAEVANVTRIPRQRVYDVLNSLVQRGLAMDWPGTVTRYSASSPETAVDRLLAVQRGALSTLESDSDDLANALGETFASGRQESAPLEFVEMLREQSLLIEKFADLQREASWELLTYAKPPYAVTENAIGLQAARRIAGNDGDVRCIYERSVLAEPGIVAEIAEFTEAGERARVIDSVPMKLCIADGSRALFSLTDPVAGGLTATNILIDHEAMAVSLRLGFETLWEQADPVGVGGQSVRV